MMRFTSKDIVLYPIVFSNIPVLIFYYEYRAGFGKLIFGFLVRVVTKEKEKSSFRNLTSLMPIKIFQLSISTPTKTQQRPGFLFWT